MFYTGKGDHGTTRTFDSACRIPKTDPCFEALGYLDELNSLVGLCRAQMERGETESKDALKTIQNALFTIQAEVAGAPKYIRREDVVHAEEIIASLARNMEPPQGFVLPGNTPLSALIDYARAVSRRVERAVLRLPDEHRTGIETRRYLNRLSSLLYALARREAQKAGTEEGPSY